MIKLIDNPLTEMWKGIERVKQLRANSRYFWYKNPDKYKQHYTLQNKKGLKLKKCKCGCQKLTRGIWKTGHNLRLHPLPNNLGKYLGKGWDGFSKKGSSHPGWKGGRMIVDGYIYIHKPSHPNSTQDGYVLEHRLIMEKHLKRYLNKEEVVHHGNDNRLDNRFCNLALLKNQAEHNKNHIKCRDELGRYISGGVPV